MNSTPAATTTSSLTTPTAYSSMIAVRTTHRAPSCRTYSSSDSTAATRTSGQDETNSTPPLLPTFESCSSAIIAAAERMTALSSQPRSLSVAIAYEECLDVITAAIHQLEAIGSRGAVHQDVVSAYRAMRDIRRILQPSLHVRRALHF